jgi:hypothetical protein
MASTVADLIEELKAFPPEARVISLEPPFTGVRVVDQDNGSLLLCAPERDHREEKMCCAVSKET